MLEGLSGDRMLLGLVIGLALLIFMVLKTKIHSFMALIIATVVIGVVGGMPLTNVKFPDGNTLGIISSITKGFGGTLSSIGIIIGFGVVMGQIFEVSGAAKRMAYCFLKLFGKRHEEEAMAITGFFVSIPIFCDSGFVILSPIAKAISSVVKKSVIALGVALAGGLVITHSLVPPTPGPLGVAGIFNVDVGKFILINLCLAIPGAIFQEAFLSYIGLGIAPPNCSWGLLAKDGIKMLRVAPHEIAVPTFFICTTMLALNLLGDGLRDAFDPNLRGTE